MAAWPTERANRGYGRRAYSSGTYGQPLLIGGVGTQPDKNTIKRLRLQQQRMRDDEEVAALMLLQIMRGTQYGQRNKTKL
jgi:hypothetical protein|tara:strand:- start:154 stop:393 length:240 start_codon:yes stop_codon:yes gene_type:complete